MDQIAKLVTSSSIGSQESAKACQDLSALAFDLQGMVGRFKLDNSKNLSMITRTDTQPDRANKPPAIDKRGDRGLQKAAASTN